jgi:hypothetical protein
MFFIDKMGNINSIEPKYTVTLQYLSEIELFLDIDVLRVIPDDTNILLSIKNDRIGHYTYSMHTTPNMSQNTTAEFDNTFSKSDKSIRNLINIYKKLPPSIKDYYDNLPSASNLKPRIKVPRSIYYKIMNCSN